MPWPKYIYNEYTKHLETMTGDIFINSECEPETFNNIEEVKKYLRENNMDGVIGRKIKMD